MEWDFTRSQLFKGEVNYTLEDFLRDLQKEIDTNFPNYNEKQRKKLCCLFYGVMYFTFNGYSQEEISKIFKIHPEFTEIIVNNNQTNIEMLGAVIMNIFLQNLQETDGFLSDAENLKLLNIQLQRFHKLYNL